MMMSHSAWTRFAKVVVCWFGTAFAQVTTHSKKWTETNDANIEDSEGRLAGVSACVQWARHLGRDSDLLWYRREARYRQLLQLGLVHGLGASDMSLRENENKDLKRLMDWHLQQANKNPEMRDFHIWAGTLISLVREIR